MRPRPMRADARRNYERLISTARAAFMEHGTNASLDDIARRAGVGSGTLYRHFPTRDDLLHAVLRERIEGLLAHAAEAMREPDPDAALVAWLRGYLDGAMSPRGTSSVLIEAMSPRWSATRLGTAAEAIRDAVGGLLERAQRAGAIRADTDAADLLRLTNAIGVAAERTRDPAGYADRMLVLLFDGLRAR
ncbi:TetR/AcrR family transcriptional regulator [Actinomadura violacea]|uniref:TetR/AcrR family transcriptional regulator n=1 Tax=Actinomadura violacea TaxID=2819934 RepID=A0ABS3S7Z8_9ACTN|nr:TetR family transcriptional regulator [Actinomadura violacea]MBO2464350.1 TetR/AcrR family transcriptional regulator [Actinomadura violacea]